MNNSTERRLTSTVSTWKKSVDTTARGLRTQELTPGGAMSSRSRTEAVVFPDPSNGARGEPYSELAQFTLDAAVAPSRVLPCQAHDQCGRLVVDGWATW